VQFGDQVRILREAQRISQTELGRRLDLATATISSYEQGNRKVRVEEVPKVAAALDVDPRVFFDDSAWHEVEALLHEVNRLKASVLLEAARIMQLYRDATGPGPHASSTSGAHVPAPAPAHVDKPRPRKAHGSQFWGEIASVPLAAGAR
jgi:transcriptional regulator with XRE-family HTH domain